MSKNKKSNGNGGPTLRHAWELYQALTEGKTEEGHAQAGEEPKVVDDYYLDCQGRRRQFRLGVYRTSLTQWLEAAEIHEGKPTGWFFRLHFEEGERPPYGELRAKVMERLSTRDLVRDPKTGKLEILEMKVRAQVAFDEKSETGPDLLIDGDRIAWEEFGELLKPFEGFGLRIQIVEGGEE